MKHEPMFYIRFFVRITTPEGKVIERFLQEETRLTRDEIEKRKFQWQFANPGLQICFKVRGEIDLDSFL